MSVSLTTCEHSARWRKYPLFLKDSQAAYIKILGSQDVNVFVSFVAMVVADTTGYLLKKADTTPALQKEFTARKKLYAKLRTNVKISEEPVLHPLWR